MVPGSHKGPLYSHFKDGAFVSAITDPAFDPSTAVHVEVADGWSLVSPCLNGARIGT